MQIAVAPGDGIGKEVIPVAEKILQILHPDWEYIPVLLGYDCFVKTGIALPKESLLALFNADAILFGAVTTPSDPDYSSVILSIRKELDLYANLRPIIGHGFDIMIVRENTEGLYSGIEWQEKDRACSLRVVSEAGTRRIAKTALALAKKRKGHVTIGNKANILRSDAYFNRICIGEAEASGIRYSLKYIDALVLDLLQHPDRYDVILTTNIFGDILSDAAGYLVGGLGCLPSANIGERHALFEPVHGSAPDIAGTNTANPVAAIRSAAMLLEHLGDPAGAAKIHDAINQALHAGCRTHDQGGLYTTSGFGEEIVRFLTKD